MTQTTDHTTALLHYRGGGEAALYLWVRERDLVLSVDNDIRGVSAEVRTSQGAPLWRGDLNEMPVRVAGEPGIYEVILRGGALADEANLRVVVQGDAFPFILPGPGIVHSHFFDPGPRLLLGPAESFTLWTDVPKGVDQVTVQSWLPAHAPVTLTSPSGRVADVQWRTLAECGHRTAVVPTEGESGWWRVSGQGGEPFRFTTREGLPLFFERPPGRFPYAVLTCAVQDETGAPADARVAVARNGSNIAVYDLLAGEPGRIHLPPLTARIIVSRGIEYGPHVIDMSLSPSEQQEVNVRLRRVLPQLTGWVSGDLHLHTCWGSDGACMPEQEARAGRAQGLDYIFISDIPSATFEIPPQPTRSRPFLILPGEELLIEEAHTGALNMPVSLVHLIEPDDPRATVANWLAAVREFRESGGAAMLMLNHPSHFPEVMAGHGYFRSWWLADEFPEFGITENFDFPSWFERLNRGRRLTGLWNTDSHDAVLLAPGAKRNYVFVGPEMNERTLMEGLSQGRCFCTREPGALLLLHVNGATMGDTAIPDRDGWLTATVECHAARPIERVELIADGAVAHVWEGEEELRLSSTARLRATMGWLIARAYVQEEEQPVCDHTPEPLMASGCVAFTNPVWVQRAGP